MTHKWAMETIGSKELLSQNGKVIVHDNPRELAWVLRGPFKVVELPKHGIGRPLVSLRDVLPTVQFPLDTRDFRDEV